MPTNRHALIRYQVIDRCLQRRHLLWTSVAMAEACADALAELDGDATVPSRATISRDLQAMRQPYPLGYNAPIEWDPHRNTFYYADPEFSISAGRLREEDLQALDGALDILRQYQYFGQVSELEDLAARVQQSLRSSRRQGPPLLLFSQPADSPAYRWLNLLYRAAEREQCLQVYYRPFEDEAFEAVVSPYLLREYNRRWFLIAYRHDLRRLRTFALDRIQSAGLTTRDRFYRLPDFQPDRHFHDIIGVTVHEDRPVEEVRFYTTPLRARYLLTKPVHHSLRVEQETPDRIAFCLRVIPNFELESWLLSFGEEVQVLQPQWLADKLYGRLQAAVSGYQK